MEILFVLGVVLAFIVVLGHCTWLLIAWFFRQLLGSTKESPDVLISRPWMCLNCGSEVSARLPVCNHCGTVRPTELTIERLRDLAATARQIERFERTGRLTGENLSELKNLIETEQVRLTSNTSGQSVSTAPIVETERESTATLSKTEPQIVSSPVVVAASFLSTEDNKVSESAGAPFTNEVIIRPAIELEKKEITPPRRQRRPFTEVLKSFMEESNIRWGEIIGGLLIIGCSTALVVSLWAQISQIPVLKFLIFTTVTAVLFGIGLYTEHRWKLPTTSRGILTIATLLVPLNFLAIAAVSLSNTSGMLVIASELAAPAIFLCLVYFAGRVIAPGCAHVLSAGVLGSSIGQLLVRHFAAPDSTPALLVVLGAFPVICYVATVGLALRRVLADREIDESETSTVFTVLGTMSFAALLPFGLLLYKAGPLATTMMYLALLVTAWGIPLLATGSVLWRHINEKRLVASRTTGTALGILGVMIVLAGMVLAWPNPESIVPAALLNFAIFTALAVALELPIAHLIGATCFALAYLVGFHVAAGHISWQNLRVVSLLDVSVSVSSGNALVALFLLFLGTSEWLVKRKRTRDAESYFSAACLIGIVSLTLVTALTKHQGLWIVYGVYALSAIWIAWRRSLPVFAWIGSALLLFAVAESFSQSLFVPFPWQTALLFHATVGATAAIVTSRRDRLRILSQPLNAAALITCALGVLSLFQTNPWQVTSSQVERVFWIAGILLLFLWLNRRRALFTAFQIAVTAGFVLTIKATLQQYDWYTYLPHAFLHPWGLQIQGSVLALLALFWITLRLTVKRATQKNSDGNWLAAAWRVMDTRYSLDRLISWGLLGTFLLLTFYGALSGVTQELAAQGSDYPGVNVAGFPHQEALAPGSWILLGLLTLVMLANLWERRRSVYLLGALATVSGVVPLLAGRFENQIAVATAWRWFGALFLLAGSVLVLYREKVARHLGTIGWPQLDNNEVELSDRIRTTLLSLTITPLAFLTVYPAVRAIYYLPIEGPARGFFSILNDGFSYAVPLVIVALVMVGYALRERLPRFAFYAGFLCNTTVTLSYLLSVVAVHGSMDRKFLVTLAQLNAITLSVYLILWLSARKRWQSALDQAQTSLTNYLLWIQMWLAVSLNVIVIVPLAINLLVRTESAGLATVAAGSFLGWITLALTLIAASWLNRIRQERLSPILLTGVLLGIDCQLAFSISAMSGWAGLHSLTIATTVTSWLLLAASRLKDQSVSRFGLLKLEQWQSSSWHCATMVGAFAVGLSVLSLNDLDQSYWWSIAPLLAGSALAATLNWETLQHGYLYAAGLLFNSAFAIWWVLFHGGEAFYFTQFLEANIVVVCLSSLLWLRLELRARRQRGGEVRPLPFHGLAAIVSLGTLAVITWMSFASGQAPIEIATNFYWFAFASLVVLLIACFWDRHARFAVAGLYVLGLLGGARALNQADLTTTRLIWAATMFLAIYSLVVTLLWRWRAKLFKVADQLGIPLRIEVTVTQLDWLCALTVLSVGIVSGYAYWIDLHFAAFSLRASAALAVVAQAITLGLLSEGVWRHRWQRAAIGVFLLGVVLLGWSWLTPGLNATWLNRSVIMMVSLFSLVGLYGIGLKRLQVSYSHWTESLRAATPWALASAAVGLFFCLSTEVFYQFSFGAVRVNSLSLFAIGLTLVMSVALSVFFALSPAHDPLGLSERGRMRYVFIAEGLLALLFVHIRLTLPWLFTGFFERYWPLVVMAIAYLGVATSESLRRRKLLVLAQPLERTGAFLPLLPVFGFWVTSSEVDFSLLLFVIGGLYGLLSILRRSVVFGMLAAITGNCGLWYMLHRTADYQLFQHPQLWLIPAALSVLAAAYLNEEKLTEDQTAGIRYLSLVTIYASSTADIFLNGVADSPWLPLILGTLSLAGVFSGIVFRIRGMLFLGSVFLLLSITTMIWYASANFGWTWLWYVAGIVTGASIIFMFAVFEKKRSEVMRMMDGLREWER
jgi:hypothetical protein